MAQSMKPGGGGRFAKLEGKLAGKKGIYNPAGLAAAIGRKKFGGKKMAKFAAKGKMDAEDKVDKGVDEATEKK